ncbi:MAG TPA: hypothetical protein VFB79_05760 [Candidatus Angelobacter sp.]|nr:hypothetical protein [Candidatus Angelobacter sp.]
MFPKSSLQRSNPSSHTISGKVSAVSLHDIAANPKTQGCHNAFLGGENGSKSSDRTDGGMPGPESDSNAESSGRPANYQSRAYSDSDDTAGIDSVDAVA